MSGRTVRLSKIISALESGGRPKGGASNIASGILSLGGEHVSADGTLDLGSKRFVPADYYEDLKRGRLKRGDILIVKDGATTGKVGFVDSSTPLPAAVNEHVFRLEVNEKIADQRYVFYHLLSPLGNRQILQDFRGATVGGISQDFIECVELSLPDLSEQKQIAILLAQADRMRRARRYALELTDTFLSSAFLRIFGDPKENKKNWSRKNLSDICIRFADGPFGSNLKSEHYRSDGVRVIRLNNIGIGEFVDKNKAFISVEHFQTLRKHECLPGDVLIGTLGDPNLRACIQPPTIKLALNKADCVQARPDSKKTNAAYLCALLNLPSTLYLVPGMVHGQTRGRVSMGEIAELPVPVPPLGIQTHFAELVRQYELLRASQREALRQTDHLFQSLLYRSFAAEL